VRTAVVVVVVVGVGRGGHGVYGGGGGVWFGELLEKRIRLFMPNRYHCPLSDITTISGTRFCTYFKAHIPHL
jgi:hypothetical protein